MRNRAWRFLLPLLLMAGILTLNWRLNHPPLSKADLQLQTIIAGTQRIEIRYFSCQRMAPCAASGWLKKSFVKEQMQQLVVRLRFLDVSARVVPASNGRMVTRELYFWRGHTLLAHMVLTSGRFTIATVDKVGQSNRWKTNHRLQPRLEKGLNAILPSGDFDEFVS